MNYWLVKSEPTCYSIDDLKRDNVGIWDDVRNYQARNFMRSMKKRDKVLFYHSSCDLVGVVGLAEVEREAYPDPSQFDTNSYKFDPKSMKQNPRWSSVDLIFIKKFSVTIPLSHLKLDPQFNDMLVVRKGMRLSVQPVNKYHYDHIVTIAKLQEANIPS